MARQSKNDRQRDRRQAQQKVLRQARKAFAARRFWHGGAPGLTPGTVLLSREQPNSNFKRLAPAGAWSAADPTRGDRVYFSTDLELARYYAAQIHTVDSTTGVVMRHGNLYEVEPVGPVEPDPDFGHVSWCAPGARILSVTEEDVNLDTYEATRQGGRYITWTDGSPVYDADGRYLRSPEQRAAGFDHPLLSAVLPWTPLASINAWLIGGPSGERPEPATYPGVLHQGMEAGPLIVRHRHRAETLVDAGVTFQNAAHIDRESINSFLGQTAIGDRDQKTAVVAEDEAGRLISVLVLTVARFDDYLAAFVETIKTEAQWRHKGVGSVLLLSGQNILPEPLGFFAGHCSLSIAPFFAQLGFTVMHPGVPLVLPSRNADPKVVAGLGEDECWFYRQGRL